MKTSDVRENLIEAEENGTQFHVCGFILAKVKR